MHFNTPFCAVSNLPINLGDPVKLLFGIKTYNKGFRLHSEDTFKPIACTLNGLYSGYPENPLNRVPLGHSLLTSACHSHDNYMSKAVLREVLRHHMDMPQGRKRDATYTANSLMKNLIDDYKYDKVHVTQNTGEINYLLIHDEVFHDATKQILWKKPDSHIYEYTEISSATNNLKDRLQSTEARLLHHRQLEHLHNNNGNNTIFYPNKHLAPKDSETYYLWDLIQELAVKANLLEAGELLQNKFNVDNVVIDILKTIALIQFMNRHNIALLPSRFTSYHNPNQPDEFFQLITKWRINHIT